MYELELLPSAATQLVGVPAEVLPRLIQRIALLRDDPYPPDARCLTGWPNLHRIRERDQRLVYEVDPPAQRLTLIVVGQEARAHPTLLRQLDHIMSIVGEAETLRRLAVEELEDAADASAAREALALAATRPRLAWGGVEARLGLTT